MAYQIERQDLMAIAGLAIILSLAFMGCDQSTDTADPEVEVLAKVKLDIVGTWSLFESSGKRLPFIIDDLGGRSVSFLSEKMTFNADGSIVITTVYSVEGYEEYPVVLTARGIYAVDSKSILSSQIQDAEIDYPDELREFLKNECGYEDENFGISEGIYEGDSAAFELDGDTLTIFTAIQDWQGAQTLDDKVYLREY